MNWEDIANDLPIHGKTRVQCCGKNRDAVISNTPTGISYYCFKCDIRLFHSIHTRTLNDLYKINELNEQPPPTTLPKDFSDTIPLQHRIWLYKAGITQDEYTQAGIGWSDSLQRIVLPLRSPSGDVLYFQCRAVHPGQIPKYKNPSIEKSHLLYTVNLQHTDRIVVCEDILSTIKVGRHIPACSILGTKTSDEQAAFLSDYKLVSYWLDPDKAGIQGSKAGARKLSLVTETEILKSEKDPKNLSDREIRNILGLPDQRKYIYHGCIITKDNETQKLLRRVGTGAG